MTKLFISHSSQDDAFVRELRTALADQGLAGWVDLRELRGGDPLWPEIQKPIEAASAFAVVVSPDALQSKWVGKELKHALSLRAQRGRDRFPVIPLSLDGTKLGVLEQFLDEEPRYIPVSSEPGGVEGAMNAILVALGKRLPADAPPTPQPKAEPLEELVLELTDLKFHEQDGVRRASARARLVYEPATPGQADVHSANSWRLIAPIGPIETGELRWYLDQYAVWPSHYFRDRARQVEENLMKWGRLLHEAAMPVAHTAKVIGAWEKTSAHAGRRFSVHVDTALEAGAAEADVKTAREAATLLLGLPWELLHDGTSYIFQGAKPARVRRRLPSTEGRDVPIVATPIRILLITARPEDDACGYLDHRASALPLVEAMEALPGLVKIHVLSPPTLPALREELDRARNARQPYHVVHFDGHGVYDRHVGLGGLCFELPEDTGKLERRRHVTVFTSALGPLLRDHRIPLVFLEACQTAQAEQTSESVASELLKVGVASVVAMSHSVLVETAKRFVAVFYRALAEGQRVGDAMLAGQRQLKDDTFRGRIFGAGELRLEDWFVPVLFQEKDDPQLFRTTPAKQTVEDFQAALTTRLGALPPVPETGFVGRSRELLALERLLRHERYAVVRGQGGEGKTALAAEFARWMVRSQQMRRAVFVSVETHSHIAAVLDAIGRQLVPDYSVATFDDLERARHPIEQVLAEQPTLLVLDNLESILLPPWIETPAASSPALTGTLSPSEGERDGVRGQAGGLAADASALGILTEDARRELDGILALCERLLQVGDTRLIFTSREPMPAPFAAERQRRELHQPHPEDAVKLVERVLSVDGAGTNPGGTSDAAREQIEQLVEAVHCHPRTLTLLAPALRERGVEATRQSLVELMAEMERQFPGSREQSVFASVELSLRRMSPSNRDRARVLGVFHGGVDLDALRVMMQWEKADVASLAGELVATGLATPNRYNYLTLNPALCPYLRGRMESTEREVLTARWVEAMCIHVARLHEQSNQNAALAGTLTALELPNLFALLECLQRGTDTEATVDLIVALTRLLQFAGKPRLLATVQAQLERVATTLPDAWSHVWFAVERVRIDLQISQDRLREGADGTARLLERARAAGERAYPRADYDLAYACWLRAGLLKRAGVAPEALALLDEAIARFEVIAAREKESLAGLMAAKCLTDRGDLQRNLGHLDDAMASYEEGIRRAQALGDVRQVAVSAGQVGTARLRQHRFADALAAFQTARERFKQLDDPGSEAVCWHNIGRVYRELGQPVPAEDAFRQALAIKVCLGSLAAQASTLAELASISTVLGKANSLG